MSPSVKPFDEIKYMALMDGLECSEISFSEIIKTTTLRFDTEYYKKSYLAIENFVVRNHTKFSYIEDFGLKIDASAFYPSLEPFYNKGTIPFIRVADVKNSIDYDNCITIPKMGDEFKTLNLCHMGDIVLTKGGRVGSAGLVTQDSYVTRDLIFIDSSKLNRKDYIMLYMYLCTNFAYRQMIRASSMTAQPHLTITLMRELLIFNFSDCFKIIIQNCYDCYEKFYEQSKILYSEAEKILNSNLGLDEASTFTDTVSIKSLSDSFGKTGRLDAEYYQKKFDNLFEMLSKFRTQKLGGSDGIVSIKKSIEPGSDMYSNEGVHFVRVSDISKYGISIPQIRLPLDIVEDVTTLYPKKDSILFSKDGSVGIAYKMEADAEIITSSALLHLTVRSTEEVLPDYLTLVLNSPIVQLQAERASSGAIIQHWKPSEIENVVIPILDIDTQKAIAQKTQESFALRHRSEKLLEHIKCTVELAIEKGEYVATEWLKERGVEI